MKFRKTMKMVLRILLGILLFLGTILLLLGVKNLSDSQFEKMSGEWECAESLVEDEEVYTQFLCMDISPWGRFSIYDGEGGNPGIEGWMIRTGSNKVLMICTNFADFDPPPGWWEMKKIETIEYEIDDSNDILFLKYKNEKETATLKFYAST